MTMQTQTTTYVQVRPYVWLVYPSDLTKADKFNAWFGVGPAIDDLSRVLKVEGQAWIPDPHDPTFTRRNARALDLIDNINSHDGWVTDIPAELAYSTLNILRQIGAHLNDPCIIRNGDILHFYAISGLDCYTKTNFLRTQNYKNINTEPLDERFLGEPAVQTPPTPPKAPITDPGATAGSSKPPLESVIQARVLYNLLHQTQDRLFDALEVLEKIPNECPIYRREPEAAEGGIACVLALLANTMVSVKYIIDHPDEYV